MAEKVTEKPVKWLREGAVLPGRRRFRAAVRTEELACLLPFRGQTHHLPNSLMAPWIPYALLSALFAALTAIFAKIGIKGVDSDLATAIRTVVILLLAWGIALARGATAGLPALTGRTWLFLVLSGVATGASWLCYFRALKLGPVSKVAPVDKLSVALSLVLAVVFLGETISVRGALGAGLILAGTVVLVWA